MPTDPHSPGRLMAESSTPDATAPSQAPQATQETGAALYSWQRSTKTSSYPPGEMCGTTSSDSRSIKRQWSSRRLRQPHSPPHRTMLQQQCAVLAWHWLQELDPHPTQAHPVFLFAYVHLHRLAARRHFWSQLVGLPTCRNLLKRQAYAVYLEAHRT